MKRLKNRIPLKEVNDAIQAKHGPNVWITKNGGMGWIEPNPEFEALVNKIFQDEQDHLNLLESIEDGKRKRR